MERNSSIGSLLCVAVGSGAVDRMASLASSARTRDLFSRPLDHCQIHMVAITAADADRQAIARRPRCPSLRPRRLRQCLPCCTSARCFASARCRSAAVANLRLGFFSSSRSIKPDSASGISGLHCQAGRCGSWQVRFSTAIGRSARNGGCPVAMKYRTDPRLNRSDR